MYVSGGGGRYISLHECLSFASSLCSQVLLLHQWHGIPTESGEGGGEDRDALICGVDVFPDWFVSKIRYWPGRLQTMSS